MAHVVHVFRQFQVDVAARELRRDGQPLPLPASVFDCLTYLIEHRERAVGRDELIAAVWGRTDVSDTVLGQTVLKARRAVGDTGSEQHSIRTVPRFGYRWVAEITASLIDSPAQADPSAGAVGDTPTLAAGRMPAARQWLPWVFGVLLVLVLLGLLRPPSDQPGHAAQTAGSAPAEAAIQGALVLPTRVQAPPDWHWLRLGLMDLVAEQLRATGISTVASESVVALTGTDEDPLPRLAESGLVSLAHWRIQPEAIWNQGTWRVVLEARSDQQSLVVDAEGEDVVQVARAASDALLLRLGRRPGADDNAPHGLHELLQRTRAAMLDDQFDLARTLIANAPSGLRERGELVHRLSQIELRAGNYLLVQQLLEDLLPALDAETQPVLRGRALTTLAASHVRRYQADVAERAYNEAVQLLHDRGEPAALGLALHGQGLIDMLHGRLDEAVAKLGHARLEMQAAGDALGIAQVDLNLGLIDQLRDRPADALVKLRASADRFQVLGSREERLYSLARITETHNRLLDHTLALANSDSYWPPEAHSGSERLRRDLRLTRARALIHVGRLREARELLDQLEDGADPVLDRRQLAGARASRVELEFAAGNTVLAAELAVSALTEVLAEVDVVRYLRIARWQLAAQPQGQGSASGPAPELILARADRQQPSLLHTAHARLIQAEQADASGRWPEAREAFEQALEHAVTAAVPDDLADVASSYVQALIAHKDLARAQEVAGRISPWADRDIRAAWVQARLFAALGRTSALQAARHRVRTLVGERVLPEP